MTFRSFLKSATCLSFALTVVACSGGEATKKAPDLDKYINQAQNRILDHKAYPQKGSLTPQRGHFLGRKIVKTKFRRQLPGEIADKTFLFNHSTELTIDQIATKLRAQLNVPVYVDVREFNDDDEKEDDASDARVDPHGVLRKEEPKKKMLIQNFRGSLHSFLDQVSNFYGYEWRFEDGVLSFDKFVTRLYMVKAPFGTSTITSQFGGSTVTGAGPSSGSSSTQNTSEFDVWGEVNNGLKNLLPKGANFTISKSTGTVTVTARPNDQQLIARYIKDMNAILSPRVSIQVTAFLVDITDDDDFSFSLKAALEGVTGFAFNLSPYSSSLSGLNGVASLAVLNSKQGTKINHLEGSDALLRAVHSSNRLVDHWTSTVVVQNNTPGPINLTTDEEYIKNISVNSISEGTTQITTESVTAYYGQSLQLIPRISGNDEIMISMSLNSAAVPTFTEFSASDDTKVQLRSQAKRDLHNNVPIGNGETLILSGFEQTTATRLNQGVGSPENIALGGTRDAELRRTRLILMITPTIMQRPQNRDIGTTRVLHDNFDLLER